MSRPRPLGRRGPRGWGTVGYPSGGCRVRGSSAETRGKVVWEVGWNPRDGSTLGSPGVGPEGTYGGGRPVAAPNPGRSRGDRVRGRLLPSPTPDPGDEDRYGDVVGRETWSQRVRHLTLLGGRVPSQRAFQGSGRVSEPGQGRGRVSSLRPPPFSVGVSGHRRDRRTRSERDCYVKGVC